MKRIHLLLAILMVSWVGSIAGAQTLADVARQERARKKALESKAVLTNGSVILPKGTQPGNVSVGNPPAVESVKEAAKPVAAQAGPTDNKGRDEKYWRATFDKARQDLRRAEDRLKLLDLRLNDLTAELYREGVYTREMEIRRDITTTQTQQEAGRQEVDARQKILADLEDELRRSGGPPGWAR